MRTFSLGAGAYRGLAFRPQGKDQAMDASTQRARTLFSRTGVRTIEMARGNTLTLEDAAGATVCLVDGAAWLSGARWSHSMREGEPVPVGDGTTMLIYAFEQASIRLEAPAHCSVQLRKRGEVEGMAGQGDDHRVNPEDPADMARCAELLCATVEELRKAIETVGPRIGDLKRYFLIARLRRQSDDSSS
jgi:hypothetical protein